MYLETQNKTKTGDLLRLKLITVSVSDESINIFISSESLSCILAAGQSEDV